MMPLLQRPILLQKLSEAIARAPIASVLGPRQCGKTTLVRTFTRDLPHKVTYFDLSRYEDLQALENPNLVLGDLKNYVIIDEIQEKPSLFRSLRYLVDRDNNHTKFIILGSSSPNIRQGASESLAGRVAFVDMDGFSLSETDDWRALWLLGGFPRSYLAKNTQDSFAWREDFVRTFLERDIPQLGISLPAPAMRRFWTLLAHFNGQEFNSNEIATTMGISHTSVRNYLDILTGAFILRQLPPWLANLKKRQVKSPKLYFRDSGLLHFFHSIHDQQQLLCHNKCGASFESFIVQQVISIVGERDVFFWRLHSGAELDLLIQKNGKNIGIEIKLSEAPKMEKSMFSAIENLGLDALWIVSPSTKSFPVNETISVVSVNDLVEWCKIFA